VGDEITFDGTASFAAPGFSIVEYLWDFADGTTDNSGPVVSHIFDEPGEFIVELFLTDDNGCSSTNRVSLQLLVCYTSFMVSISWRSNLMSRTRIQCGSESRRVPSYLERSRSIL